MVRAKLDLVENTKKIETKINKALIRDIDVSLKRVANRIVNPIRQLVKQSLLSQPEVLSLDNGKLAADFGLPDGRARIENIIDVWTKGLNVRTKKSSLRAGKISAGITITMVQRDYQDVLSMAEASVLTRKGQSLPWLEWLLKFGDQVIIRDYEVSFHQGRLKRSRSGLAVMVSGKGKRWRVPPEFSGTPNNNFVTRAIDPLEDEITKIIQSHMQAVI